MALLSGLEGRVVQKSVESATTLRFGVESSEKNEGGRPSGRRKAGLGLGAGLVDDEDAYEDECHGQDLLEAEGIDADADADDGSKDRLDVGVEADEGRPDTLLSVWNQEVGEEGGEEDEEADFKADLKGDFRVVGGEQALGRKREGHDQGEEEHPLHEGDYAVFVDQRAEDAEVAGET